jgi:HAD superfamily phosphatase (TIGR01668 family)
MHLKNYLKFWLYNTFTTKKIITGRSKSIYDINFDKLKQDGVKLIIFDYDDTLTGFHDDLTIESKELLFGLEKENFDIAILSNFPPHREDSLIKNIEGHNIYLEKESNKPSTTGYKKIMNKFNLKGDQTAMVGDKVGTDLWGAYLSGIKYRVLVDPYSNDHKGKRAGILFRFQRKIEKWVYNLLRAKS